MLESLVNFKLMNDRPYVAFLWSFIIACVAIIASSQINALPGVSPGFFSILLIIIPSAYVLTVLIRKEERIAEKRIKHFNQKGLWRRHERDIIIMLFFFGGLTLAFALWGFLLPEDFFSTQLTKINQIRGFTGAATLDTYFDIIFRNNIQVMLLSFVFAFIFGAGAVFIIAWNASVLGVYIGQLSKHAWEIPLISLNFIPHGIPEIAGYVTAALAGGLLSAGILRKNDLRVLSTIAFDAALLMVVAIVFIFLGSIIEVYV